MNEIALTTTEVFKFPWYLAIIPTLISLALIGIGGLCLRFQARRYVGFVLVIFGLFIGIAVAPGLFTDHITVTPTEIVTKRGFWFVPSQEGFIYRETAYVRLSLLHDTKGRARPVWEVHYRDGRVYTFNLGDLWNMNSERIMTLVKSHGVKFAH